MALAAPGLAILAWRGAIRVIEGPAPAEADGGPRCPGALDPRYAEAAARARSHLAALRAEREIPGLAAAVAVGDRIVWSEGIGYADRERDVPACAHTQFRLQSVSKLLTTAGMARLAERGVLDLDTPVSTYVPDLPAELGAVTARQLASHRAGVRHYRDDNETLNTTSYPTATASLETFRDDPLLFPPDSGSAYSSYGFVLLSAAMEGAAGTDFPTLMQREVSGPLGLSRTRAERTTDAAGPDRATFYDNVTPYSPDGRLVPSPPLDFSSKWAGGGMLATPEDLVRFAAAHLPPFNHGFLHDSTLAVLFTPRTRQLAVFGQGLGWVIARDHRLRRVRLHFGAGSGGTAVLAAYPDAGVSVAVLANLGHARFPLASLLGVVNPFVGDPYALPAWLAAAVALGWALALMIRGRRMVATPGGGDGAGRSLGTPPGANKAERDTRDSA